MAPLLSGEAIVFPFEDKLLKNRNSNGIERKLKIKVETEDECSPQDVNNISAHLCNRCWSTFMGLGSYLVHRNEGCQHSEVFIEECQNSNKDPDSVKTRSQDTNLQTSNTEHNGEIKLELLDNEESHRLQGSTNNIQTHNDNKSLLSTIHSKHGHNQTTNMDLQNKPSSSQGKFYINLNFSGGNIQRINENDKQTMEKVSETQHNDYDSHCLKKRSMNVLSSDQISNSLSFQPRKRIKLSESTKELSEVLAEILRKQKSEHNKSKHKENSNTNTISSINESKVIKLSESMRFRQKMDAILQKLIKDSKKENVISTGIKLSESMKSSKELDAILQKQIEDSNKADNISKGIKLSESMSSKELDAISESMKSSKELDAILPKQIKDSNEANDISTGIKLSESMRRLSMSKELDKELDDILQKQIKDSYEANNISKGINLSQSMSSKELDAILQKHVKDSIKANDITLDFSETLSKSKNDKDSENLDSVNKNISQVTFYNKYSEAFNSTSESSSNSMDHIRNRNEASELRMADSDEKNVGLVNDPLKGKYISKSIPQYTGTESKPIEWKMKNKRFYSAIHHRRQRKSKFRRNTLIIRNLNVNTRTEWLKEIFQRYGNIRNVNIKRFMKQKSAKGFVEYEKLSDAEKAFKLCRYRIIDGAKIKLHFQHKTEDINGGGSSTTEFGKDYEARVAGNPVRYHDSGIRNQRRLPYNLFS